MYDLSDREMEVLELVCKGLTNKEIGEMLFIATRTVETHRRTLIKKVNASNIAELVYIALSEGLIEKGSAVKDMDGEVIIIRGKRYKLQLIK